MNLHELIEKHDYSGSNYPAHIYGSAPSVSVVKKLNIQGLKIAVGDMPWRGKDLGPYDFWVTNNTYFPIPWKSRDFTFVKSCTTLISTACVNGPDGISDLENITTRLKNLIWKNEIILYDAQHFKGFKSSCSGQSCCEVFEKFKVGLSIQEELSNRFKISGPAYKIGHATINAIALAILFNCNPIFVHGVELPEFERDYKYYKGWHKISPSGYKTSLGFLKKKIVSRNRKHRTDFSGQARKQLLLDFEAVGKIASLEGIDLFYTSENTPLHRLKGFTKFNISASQSE
jgi:hypothetical protein